MKNTLRRGRGGGGGAGAPFHILDTVVAYISEACLALFLIVVLLMLSLRFELCCKVAESSVLFRRNFQPRFLTGFL